MIPSTNARPAEEHSRKRKTETSNPDEEARSKKSRASKDYVMSKREANEKKGKKAEVVASDHEETIAKTKVDKGKDVAPSDTPDLDEESDPDAPLPEHESHKKSNRRKGGTKKAKFVPDGETREQRDARSIFIGNLPVAVVKSKVHFLIHLVSVYNKFLTEYIFIPLGYDEAAQAPYSLPCPLRQH